MRTLLMLILLALAGCDGPAVDTDAGAEPEDAGPEARGSLNASLVMLVAQVPLEATPREAWVVGAPGAAVDLEEVTVDNVTTTQSASASVTAEGSFAVAIEVALGDTLSVGGAVEAPLQLVEPVVLESHNIRGLEASRDGANTVVVSDYNIAPVTDVVLVVAETGVWADMTADGTGLRYTGSIPSEHMQRLLLFGYSEDPPVTTAAGVFFAAPP